MSYRLEKSGDIVIDSFEKGIATSPHQGIANMQNVNIATEQGEVMCSFGRTLQTLSNTLGTNTLFALDTNHVSTNFPSNQSTTGIFVASTGENSGLGSTMQYGIESFSYQR